ncbi:MAG TPA: flagellin, partial [bacterium]|nr:flagellin [bacterium]
MTVINTNISSLIGMNNLRLTNLGLQTSLARLSSGLRINWAADDPSGLAIAKGMEAQIGGIRTAVQNAEDGINLIRTADGSLAATHEILLRMRDLAVRAANEATLTSADMTRLDDEFQSLVAEIDRKADAVTFNTKNLFNGDYAAGQVLQIGADNAGTYQLTVTIQSLSSAAGLGLGDDLTTLANAQAAITAVQSAIDIVSDVRANLGIQERRLNYI